jgi:poly-gamma-glutamate synthesis protein (capsule biosynthesis protein)
MAIIIGAILGYSVWNRLPSQEVNYSKISLAEGTLESHMLIAGDVYWGRKMNDWSQANPLKEAYPFSQLGQFNRSTYDAWVANLECPSVPGKNQDADDASLVNFNCNPAYLPEAAKWFTAFSLANNHMSNQGREAGQQITRTQLGLHKIQYFGGFNPHRSEDICDVVSMPARVKLAGTIKTVKLPIAMCGYHGVYYDITDKSLDEISVYSKYMPVIVMPHMGREYQAAYDQKRQALYHKMIDRGADMVIGNHPHWVQPVEAYKGKLIVYSMGNFIFDQEFNDEVTRSAAIDLVITSSDSIDALTQWTDIGEQCEGFRDRCLLLAHDQGLNKLSLSFTYDIEGVYTSHNITHRANQRKKDAIIQRMNWLEVKKYLD